jgi:hypothetical protein
LLLRFEIGLAVRLNEVGLGQLYSFQCPSPVPVRRKGPQKQNGSDRRWVIYTVMFGYSIPTNDSAV